MRSSPDSPTAQVNHLSGETDGAVLCMLADGQWHSGRDLGGRLGVTRAAIGKAVRGLRGRGAPVEARRACGYRLPGGFDPLDPVEIQRRSGVCADRIHLLARTTSTNDQLRAQRLADTGPVVVAAEWQSGGRGRRGRQWASPLGGIYLSVALTFASMGAGLSAFALSAGAAVAAALERTYGIRLGLKWPNDFLQDERKVGGILCEATGELGGPARVILGLGLNTGWHAPVVQRDHYPAGLLALPGTVSRSSIVGTIVDAVRAAAASHESAGFAVWQGAWNHYHALRGHTLHLDDGVREAVDGRRPRQGRALAVDAEGALVLEDPVDGHRFRCTSGELIPAQSSDPA